jgi:hypothetical protein
MYSSSLFHLILLDLIFFFLFQDPCNILWHAGSLWWTFVSPKPNLQAPRPPLVGCLWLLVRHIHSYPPHLEAISSNPNLRMCHAMVTRDPLQIMKLHIMQFSPVSCYIFSLTSKHYIQHPVITQTPSVYVLPFLLYLTHYYPTSLKATQSLKMQ